MSDNDLIKRGDTEEARDELVRVLNYINSSGTLDYADYCELFNTIERVFDALKAVPQEMSAREFLKARNRLCASYESGACSECPLYAWCGDDEVIWDMKLLSIVDKWVQEHPERSEDNGNS